MKKFLLLAALCAGVAFSVNAEETAKCAECCDDDYECLMISMWENAPEYQMKHSTYGLKLGVLGCGGAPVYGVEAAVIAAGSDKVEGVKGAFIYTTGKEVYGVAAAPLNMVEKVHGLQLGVVNFGECGVQFGLLNFNKNGFLPVFPLVNFPVK